MLIINLTTLLIYLTAFSVGPCRCKLQTKKSCYLKTENKYKEYRAMKEGDIIIGGVMTVQTSVRWEEKNKLYIGMECKQ
ncbi:hypothetical protein XELAEV_18008727mg [Xenopus laevis]|uniref:NTR domain-containing protein n=1 Tax=Xenopus laevis TaxID=8355 RepID=A0A974DR98_XENLA|nr:hypothetical protein XELAEV_18008727mg [Xenopus laevis]